MCALHRIEELPTHRAARSRRGGLGVVTRPQDHIGERAARIR